MNRLIMTLAALLLLAVPGWAAAQEKCLTCHDMTNDEHQKLLTREKPAYDGAVPSGNSVQALNLLRLAEFTTKEGYRKRAEKTLRSFSGTLDANPVALSEMLLAVDFNLDTPKEVIIVAPKGNRKAASSLVSAFRGQFLPNRILVVVAEGEDLARNARIIPLVREKRALLGKATAYVCENRSFRLPTGDPKVLA